MTYSHFSIYGHLLILYKGAPLKIVKKNKKKYMVNTTGRDRHDLIPAVFPSSKTFSSRLSCNWTE